ncbi:MAG: aminopeptidase N [Pseudomonadota bacterium]|nr:aminopeptidase N [Pseudomonadota bacterium]
MVFLFLLLLSNFSAVEAKGTRELSKSEAFFRSSLISDVGYELYFNLSKSETDFSGKSNLRFTLKSVPSKIQPITIDFAEGKLTGLRVNGTPIDKPKYDGYQITLSSKELILGKNMVEVDFEHPYSRNSSGLYRFKDPEDSRVYIFTDFEPYDANRMFPCFDQPDLKATYELKVDAPSTWHVISSLRETEIVEQANIKTWTFPKTLPFSTYIFALHAGPYHVWEDKTFRIPLRLFARESLASFVSSSDWFTWSKSGFDYFEKYFGFKYPFQKYDQIIVPDFSSGAMENVAAVTFSERFVKRYQPTQEDRQRNANVLLHEMAHMWFGNVVTMNWWDDLWLNESFATLMAYMAAVEVTEFKTAWVDFYQDTKQWAYGVDITPTTHPITTEVANTSVAFSNFDGITYGKGASVLKLLNYYLGPDAFQKGVQNFIQRNAFKNARFSDFIASLSEAASTSLALWSNRWFETKGVNTLEINYACKNNLVEKLEFKQGHSSGPDIARPHKMELAFFKTSSPGLNLIKKYDVSYDTNAGSIRELKGEPCPDFVFANYNDHDYVRVLVNSKDREKIKSLIPQTQDSLLRSMLIGSLWDLVLETRMSIYEFADLVLEQLPRETDLSVSEYLIEGFVPRKTASTAFLASASQDSQQARQIYNQYRQKMETLLWTLLKKEGNPHDAQLMYFDALVRVTFSDSSLTELKSLLMKQTVIKGFTLDQDRRWDILKKLVEFDIADLKILLDKETESDKSDTGKKALLAIEAIRPGIKNKKKWLTKIFDRKTEMSYAEVKAVANNLLPRSQMRTRLELSPVYYSQIPKFKNESDISYVESMAGTLAPLNCSKESSKKIKTLAHPKFALNSAVQRLIVDLSFWDDKCEKIKSFSWKQFEGTQKRD